MPRIFNSIRQRLLKENRLTRYLVYAIGEIVLVVIGILIALSINTWNKGRQDLQAQYELLQDLRDDLVIQQELIAEQITFEEGFVSQIDSARGYERGQIGAVELQAILFRLTTRHTFVANKATMSKMTSSGQIALIRNASLENSIVRYYQLSDYTTTVTNNNNLFIVDMQYGPFVSDNALGFGCAATGEMENELMLDREKRYLLRMKLLQRERLAKAAIGRFKTLQTATNELLELIDHELKGS